MLVSDVVVVSEPRGRDFRMLLAADRAGARAVLDTEWLDSGEARQRIERLDSVGLSNYGLLVGPGAEAWLPQVLANASSKVTWIVVTGGCGPGQQELLAAVRQATVPVWFEAIHLGELRWAAEQRVDGLILKGHEAGGRIGEDSSFLLCQGAARLRDLGALGGIPWYVRGGVGLRTAGALLAGGAQGVVLDQQLSSARESPKSGLSPGRTEVLDGSETAVLDGGQGIGFRHYVRMGPRPAVAENGRAAEPSPGNTGHGEAAAWGLIHDWLAEGTLLPMSQDRAWASSLARDHVTTAGILDALVEHANRHVRLAQQVDPFREGSPFAEEHGIRFPIVQGPMTRVSDTASFAEAVAVAGGLPFLALALLRGTECDKLLNDTKARLGSRAWGVGLLGFVPAELRDEQLAAISRCHPPFALIAGGRPDQAKSLEQAGIPTYLHVPSPGLLRMFLRDGARRFVFEGRECGGHVGPRTSLVLWEQMCQVVEEHLQAAPSDTNMSLVFAGGVHDARSCAMVAALIAPLAARGVRCGVLMGTAYLFTREAITSGAIVPQFQQQALACQTTTLLQTAPGHAIRCVPTPYCDDFRRERERLLAEGHSAEEITRNLEWMNLGRLRLASKGLERSGSDAELVSRADDDQLRHGMYMIGQVAALRDQVTSMIELHEDVCLEGARHLSRVSVSAASRVDDVPPPCEIAIVGMACFYPGSSSLGEYWNNILRKVDAVTEIPASHWDWRLYYDPDLRTRDKIISKWGGFLRDMDFDPLHYGITPNSLYSIEPLQLYLLEATRRALADAGYQRRSFPRERTAAILGIGGGGSPLAVAYGLRTCLPLLNTVPGNVIDGEKQLELCRPHLPEWTEDSFPGILSNVAVGRVANRFDLGGPNYAIDAACGSSLAAVHACVRELQTGTSDFALAMGADTVQTPYAYMAFSKTFALSPRGRCRPFDAEADGIVLSEGIGVVALKRLADAVRDGDRIYAVIQGMGASSDGRDKGLTAPRAEGQLRALRRAYAQARISPADLELIEAHGTGTVVGDQTESRTLSQILEEAGAEPRSCLVGSVKSMIGHSKCAAGIAGLIKTALALNHRVLPPTIVEHPNSKGKFGEGPLSLNTEAIPWVHDPETPRRAGVSAFGFGGTNFHAVLSEHVDMVQDAPAPALTAWPAELCVWSAENANGLRRLVQESIEGLARIQAASCERVSLAEIAAGLWRSFQPQAGWPTLAVVATSHVDLAEKLKLAWSWLSDSPRPTPGEADDVTRHLVRDPRGVYLTWERPGTRPRTAMLFAGQGSQYLRMGAEIGLAFPRFQQVLNRAAGVLRDVLPLPLARYLYPGTSFSPDEERAQYEAITSTEIAQPALGAVDLGYWYLLGELGIAGDCLAGHSFGEYVALCASGCLTEAELLRLAYQRGRVIRDVARNAPGGMTALDCDGPTATSLIDRLPDTYVANFNSPRQTVVAHGNAAGDGIEALARQRGIRTQRLPVACAFHSPLVAAAGKPLSAALAAVSWRPPQTPVYGNGTATRYPQDAEAIRTALADHLRLPVRFCETVERLYHDEGIRIFLEVGPHSVLSGLVGQTLTGLAHTALSVDQKGRSGMHHLMHVLAQLVVQGTPVRGESLFQPRDLSSTSLEELVRHAEARRTPTTWVVNSVRSRPWNAPEPHLIGQTLTSEPGDAATSAGHEQPARSAAAAPMALQSNPPTPRRPAAIPAVESQPMNAEPESEDPQSMDDSSHVMLGFQQLMSQFLDTQRAVMTAYLQGSPGTVGDGPNPVAGPPAVEQRREPVAPSAALPESPQVGELVPDEPRQSPPPVEPNGAPKDRDWLISELQDLISKRTGYPRESLTLDLNLEADLGIDSIKRVEILGEISEKIHVGNGAAESNGSALPEGLEMEKLTSISTLRGIVDYLESALHPNGGGESQALEHRSNGQSRRAAALPSPDDVTEMESLRVQRAGVRLVDLPLLCDQATGVARSTQAGSPELCGTVLIVQSAAEDHSVVADRLRSRGCKIVFVECVADANPRQAATDRWEADLTRPDGVKSLVESLRTKHSDLAGLLFLLPISPLEGNESWDVVACRETKALYLLARNLADDLRRSGTSGTAFLVAVTALGGSLGYAASASGGIRPGSGGVLGFVKSLAREWPEVLVRGLDMEPAKTPSDRLAQRLLNELSDPDGPYEVGYYQDRRVTWEPVSRSDDTTSISTFHLASGAPILITGGARGITATIALELARQFQPRLLIVGRAAIPPSEEPSDIAGLTSVADLKGALLTRLEREGRPPSPALVESQFRDIQRQREMRANLAALRETGVDLEYCQIDVRDATAFASYLDDVQARFGPIVGVVHGAGVIEDRLVRDKTPESFDRVFDTKVVSARVLSERLQPEHLQFMALFVSLASRYGNRGQADYSAANEVVSKLALQLNRAWPGRVFAVAWGPWAEIGMVADLERHLTNRGLQLIRPDEGPRLFVDELRFGSTDDAEILIGGGTKRLAQTTSQDRAGV